MNRIERPDVESVLAQMRAMRDAAQGQMLRAEGEADVPPPRGVVGEAPAEASFGTTLKGAIDQVNATQRQATELSNAFVKGDTQDLVSVMVALQKSSVAFQAVTQVRNRLVSAYQDIMNMPI